MSWIDEAVWFDFETLPTEDRPARPPVPVGLAIKWPGKSTVYHSWGHPTGNNSTFERARADLAKAWAGRRPLAGQNVAKFDCPVAEEHFGFEPLPWQRVHDTLPMLFLHDPRADDYKLKPSAERILGLPPGEQEAVEDWLIDRQPVPGVKLGRAYSWTKDDRPRFAGAYVALAPGELAGPYACGDVDRAEAIARVVYPSIESLAMVGAYDRERQLWPVIREMEEQGVRVDVERLARDVETYERHRERLGEWLRKRLDVSEDWNPGSADQLAEALIRAGVATQASLGVTVTGKTATNKAALDGGVTDPQVLSVLRYSASLDTCLDVFMRKWLRVAQSSGGLIYTTWHSTRDDYGESGAGARTGRLSSTPNFQNLAKMFRAFFALHGRPRLAQIAVDLRTADEATAKALQTEAAKLRALPDLPFRGLDPLPLVRSYVVPYEDGDVLADADANQQELRITAHYEDGAMRQAYLENEWLDLHDFAQGLILRSSGKLYPRTQVKITGFRILYGSGIGSLAEALGVSVPEAKALKKAYLDALGGVRDLDEALKKRGKDKLPIRTLGGRLYYCEEPRWIVDKRSNRGRWASFEYRLLNLLVQGSAADHIKLAMLHYHAAKPKRHRLLMAVHDQLLVSCPKRELATCVRQLHEAIDSVHLDVPMRSEAKWSATNWAELKPYDKKGKLVAQAA